ncbi:type I-E CRISPR-associated protein Cas7/Cse4/CasC [Stella sp.]|uniref:type I-E CRISPR-associated protein Cas7/Cse4/CasC n=1 Tax=Stella sp. TaxID=2912054 RepID=UPI0035AFC0AD
MTTFLQLHLLTAYPPANLNRDDAGQPKTARFGEHPRLRVSSQSLKRAWRSSPVFAEALAGHLGRRTQRLGRLVRDRLVDEGIAAEAATKAALAVAAVFGKSKPEKDPNPTDIEQLAFVSPDEENEALAVARRIAAGETVDAKAAGILRPADGAVDIAMFGRMLADSPDFNREAAVQVAHAITTHAATVEDDFYVAVDDLKRPAEDAGAGFLGEAGFGAGLFYLYLCIDRDLLVRNLCGREELARAGLAALLRAAATVGPTGKQASFASRARASFVLAEAGAAAPRTLAAAFLKPVRGEDIMGASIAALLDHRDRLARAYGEATEAAAMDAHAGTGTLDDVLALVAR